ncbi:HAMP domain-containing histidine kinase [Candidatus Saccharibacteria bacterium]|nr:HAMP domain-containing histidine kinase [Candidatus Saccharibacteria bacterium]
MESEVNGILVAAHELEAPFNLLRQLAFSLDYADDKEDIKRVQSKMIDVSDRAIRQIQDLTKIGRLEDGLFEMEPVAVRAVCDDVVEELRYLFRFNHRDLKIEYRNRSRLVNANRDLLYSIIYNFCLNAVHYSDQEARSELVISDKNDKVRIDIRDYGPSLPIDVWRSLKKGWIEKPTSIAMRPGSSGLGLYIASKFSQYMNADVGAVRHRDGTSFFVELSPSRQASLF